MGAEDGHAHAGAGHAEVVDPHDLATFVEHLHLFLGVAVVEKLIDVGDEVEGDLVWVDLFLHFTTLRPGAGLLLQFDDAPRHRCRKQLDRWRQ